jgi:hypothetical protein
LKAIIRSVASDCDSSSAGIGIMENAWFFKYLRDLPADYPNGLASSEPQRRTYSLRYFVLATLVLFSLLPRALISLKISSVCPDGVLYIRLAEALGEGHYQEAFREMNLNLYPVVLAALHRMGFGWETGAVLWNLLASSLVVLPLYGLARRQFDDTVAAIACIFYATHPIFIQWSPEIMRDPTFWLLYTLSLYLQWRAATEVRIGIYLAAGLTTALAILTRLEGLFLLFPFCLWTFWRYRALHLGRVKRKLVIGGIVFMAVFPALLLLANVFWLRNHSQWEFIRFSPFVYLYDSWSSLLGSFAADGDGTKEAGRAGISLGRMVTLYVPTLVKSLTPYFGLLMLGGMWGWRRTWSRRDHQTLFYTALVILLAVWLHTWYAHESCIRYFLPIVLMGSPFAALGLLGLSRRILRLSERFRTKAVFQCILVFAPVTLVALGGWSVAFSSHFEQRTAEVELAEWIRREYGPSAMLLGSEGITPVVAYYARVNHVILSKEMTSSAILERVRSLKPQVIFLLATSRNHLTKPEGLIRQIEALGYAERDRGKLPPGANELLVVLTSR